MAKGIDTVAHNALTHFAKGIHPQALRLFTPFPPRVPLASCHLSPALTQLLERYEPKVETDGLLPHQAHFLKAYLEDGQENFLLTTATGSGKSLCFWAWVLEHLRQEAHSTALLCFPTQALMWGQAERLARLSELHSLTFPGQQQTTPYGGAVRVGHQSIPWTLWHGVGQGYTYDPVMAEHEKSEAFALARLRLATLDKAHWSLIKGHPQFLAHLRCLVLDEAHTYGGVFGLNVHYFLKRVYLARELWGQSRPSLFLASATLSSAHAFARTLLSLNEAQEIVHITDSTQPQVDLIPVAEVPEQLSQPPTDGLLRIVLLLHRRQDEGTLLPFLGRDQAVGPEVNTIYFSPSKFHSKRLAAELQKKGPQRRVVIYDADLPPHRRRQLEKELNDPALRGLTVLATSALELGVDIEGLDVCFLEDLPPRRMDLLQRIGRVGRRVERPGLVILRLSAEPQDQRLWQDPVAAFHLDLSRPLPIPRHLEMLKWRHMLAAFAEWHRALKAGEVDWVEFLRALRRHFGEAPLYRTLRQHFADRYGLVVDMSDPAWVYKGFRATASEGKIPLREGAHEIARIDEAALFRDAHPEAVFLGHDLNRYRVVAYEGAGKVTPGEPSDRDLKLGTWLRPISAVQVTRERRGVTTRGSWEEHSELYERLGNVLERLDRPPKGLLVFGIWTYTRTWQGYTEIDLRTGGARKVPLKEVRERLKRAQKAGEPFPFLGPLSYRTLGWQWDFGALELAQSDRAWQRSVGTLTGHLLEHFLAAALESRVEDLGVDLDLSVHRLQVLDATPGGNGLSEALLTDRRLPQALHACLQTLSQFTGEGGEERFKTYVLELCREVPAHPVQEVGEVIQKLSLQWSG